MSSKTYLFFAIFFTTFILYCQSDKEIEITEAYLQEKRDRLTPGDLYNHLQSISELRAYELNEIKNFQKENYLGFKDQFARYDSLRNSQIDEMIRKQQKTYAIEEYEYDSKFDPLYNQDTTYVRFLQSGLKFRQTFSKDTSLIQVKTKINNRFSLPDGKPLDESDPHLDFESYQDVVAKKIFYTDGSVILNPKNSSDCPEPNSTCHFGAAKSIDSIQTHFTIDYIAKVDSVTLTKVDIGKTKSGLRILEFSENMIIYEDFEDNIIETEAYDKSDRILASDTGITYITCGKTRKEEYDFNNEIRRRSYEGTKAATNLDQVIKGVENTSLDYILDCKEHRIIYSFYKGTVEKLTVFKVKERGILETDATFTNERTDYKYHINPHDDKTEFIDNFGNVLYSVPIGDLNFVYNNDEERNRYYLEDYDGRSSVYYYVNVNRKELKKLEGVRTVRRLTDNLVTAFKGGEIAIFDEGNNSANGFSYTDIAIEDGIIFAKRKNMTYTLIDNKGKEIGPMNISSLGNFNNGVAKAVQDEKAGVIDQNGTILIPFIYDADVYANLRDESFTESQIIKKDDLYGIMDLKNKPAVTVPPSYFYVLAIENTKQPLYLVKKTDNDKFYQVINTQGLTVIPAKYENSEIEEIINSGDY